MLRGPQNCNMLLFTTNMDFQESARTTKCRSETKGPALSNVCKAKGKNTQWAKKEAPNWTGQKGHARPRRLVKPDAQNVSGETGVLTKARPTRSRPKTEERTLQ